MPEEPKKWATLTDFGNIPKMKDYLKNNQQTGRRLSSLKLTQKSLNGKLQERTSNGIVSSRSYTGGREQKAYPMKYTKDDSIKASSSHQTVRKQLEKRVQKTKTESENLRAYSLKMFENALVVDNNGNSPSAKKIRSESVPVNCLDKTKRVIANKDTVLRERPQTACTNGPSTDGSLLYNKRGQLLNVIRLRPHTEYPTKYNHEKNKQISPVIKQTLCQSNCDFRVQMASPTSSYPRPLSVTSSSISDMKLVPVNGNSASNGSISEQSSINEFKTDGATRVESLNDSSQLDLIKNLMNESEECDTDVFETPRTSAQRCEDKEFLRRNMPSGVIHYYSLEYELSDDESLVEEKPPPPVEKPPTPPPEEPKPKGKARGKSGKGKKPATKKKKEPEKPPPPPPEPEPVVKPPEVKKVLKGPKCWVDDATVTSEKEPVGNDLLDTLDGAQERPPSAPGKTVTIQEKATILSKKDSNLKSENVQGILSTPKPPPEVVNEQLDVQSVTSDSMYLPPFICPSSERKSKEAHIKHWIASTNFSHAERQVPLL